MVEDKAIIINESGIHARPAAKLITFISGYPDTAVTLINGDKSAAANNLMRILALGLKKDSAVTVRVSGKDEGRVLKETVHFINCLRDD